MTNARDAAPRTLLAALAVVSVLQLAIAAFTPPPLHQDTTRDLLMARDCATGLGCLETGPRASFGELWQGASWIRMLTTWALAWPDARAPFALPALVLATALVLALGAVATTWAARELGTRSTLGLAIAFVTFHAIALPTAWWPVIWNEAPMPLAAALAFALAARSAREGSTLAALGAGLCVGLAGDLHLVAYGLAPALIVTTAATARTPAVALGVAAASFVVPAIASPRALSTNALSVGPDVLVGAALVTFIFASLATTLRPRVGRLSADARAVLAVLAITLGFAGPLVLAGACVGRHVDARYLLPCLPGAIALVARSIDALARSRWRVPAVVTLVLAGGLAIVPWALARSRAAPRDDQLAQPSIADTITLATLLREHGVDSASIRTDVAVTHAREMVDGIGVMLPPRREHAGAEEITLVLAPAACDPLEHDARAAGWTRTLLPSDRRAWLRVAPRALERREGEACVAIDGREATCDRFDARAEDATWSRLAYPALRPLHAAIEHAGDASYEERVTFARVGPDETSFRVLEDVDPIGWTVVESTVEHVTVARRVPRGAGGLSHWLPQLAALRSEADATLFACAARP